MPATAKELTLHVPLFGRPPEHPQRPEPSEGKTLEDAYKLFFRALSTIIEQLVRQKTSVPLDKYSQYAPDKFFGISLTPELLAKAGYLESFVDFAQHREINMILLQRYLEKMQYSGDRILYPHHYLFLADPETDTVEAGFFKQVVRVRESAFYPTSDKRPLTQQEIRNVQERVFYTSNQLAFARWVCSRNVGVHAVKMQRHEHEQRKRQYLITVVIPEDRGHQSLGDLSKLIADEPISLAFLRGEYRALPDTAAQLVPHLFSFKSFLQGTDILHNPQFDDAESIQVTQIIESAEAGSKRTYKVWCTLQFS